MGKRQLGSVVVEVVVVEVVVVVVVLSNLLEVVQSVGVVTGLKKVSFRFKEKLLPFLLSGYQPGSLLSS